MTQTDLDVGPIDYLVVEFPGAKLTGEALTELVDLTDASGRIPADEVIAALEAIETETSAHRNAD